MHERKRKAQARSTLAQQQALRREVSRDSSTAPTVCDWFFTETQRLEGVYRSPADK